MKKAVSPAYIVVLVLALALLVAALTIAPFSKLSISSDSAYPILVSVIGVGLAIKIAVDDYKSKKPAASEAEKTAEPKVLNKDVLIVIAMMAVYGVLLLLCGYIISTLVFSICAIGYLYKNNFRAGLLIGFIATFMVVLVFKYGFNVILP